MKKPKTLKPSDIFTKPNELFTPLDIIQTKAVPAKKSAKKSDGDVVDDTQLTVDWNKWGPVIRDSLKAFMDADRIARLLTETGHWLGSTIEGEPITEFELIWEIEAVMEELVKGTYMNLNTHNYNAYRDEYGRCIVEIRTLREIGEPKNTVASLCPVIKVALINRGKHPFFEINLVLGSQIW